MSRKLRLVVIVLLLIISVVQTKDANAKRKWVKEYIGKWYVSVYKPHDGTQNGHGTSSGRRAKSGRTVAVDYRNPKAKMNSWIHIAGFGKLRVEDYGGFGRFNGGKRAFDVFRENHEKGGLWLKKCWIYRKETKKEYKKRLAKEEQEREKARKLRQKGEFVLKYDDTLKPCQVVTDPNYVKSGSISFGGIWFDIVKTKRGLKNTILCACEFLDGAKVYLDEVAEGAVG